VLEVLLHPIVSLVFQSDPAAADTMRRPPRSAEHALTWPALRPAVILGLTVSLGVLAIYASLLEAGWEVSACRGLAFATLVLAQPPLLLVLRAAGHHADWRVQITREFVFATVACIATAVAAITVPPLANINHFTPVPAIGWLAAIGTALLAVVIARPAIK
jgi:Ca2+-transporting ATPase